MRGRGRAPARPRVVSSRLRPDDVAAHVRPPPSAARRPVLPLRQRHRLTQARLALQHARAVEDSEQRETVGERIRRLRLERGLSTRELGAPGASYAYLSRIEKGKRTPSPAALRIIARRLGVSAAYLETGELVPGTVERALRVSDAELELRLHRDLGKAESVFAAVAEEGDAEPELYARARAGLGIFAAHRGDNLAAVN